MKTNAAAAFRCARKVDRLRKGKRIVGKTPDGEISGLSAEKKQAESAYGGKLTEQIYALAASGALPRRLGSAGQSG
jgi:hypothetical protein